MSRQKISRKRTACASADRNRALAETEACTARLYTEGLICDSGRRREGQIVWIAREFCERCSPQADPVNVGTAPDRLPCEQALRDPQRALRVMRGGGN